MDLSLVLKARIALQAAAARAERVLTEIKADLKAELSRPLSPLNPNYGSIFGAAEPVGELPWLGKNKLEKRHEDELRVRILEIAERPEDYLLKAYDEAVDVRADMQSAGAILEYDENLRNLRFQFVPKKMKEHEFWRRYFIAVKYIKQQVFEQDSETESSATLQIAEHKASQEASDTEVESPRKDPAEEEEYKKAFSVAAIPPSVIVRKLASAIEVGKTVKSMQELATGRTDKDGPQSGDWSSLVSGFVAFKKLSTREKEVKPKSGLRKEYNALLWSLFEPDTQHEDTPNHDLPHSKPKLPEEVHGAPPESFVAQLAKIMASIKTEQKMAEFWLEVVKELRRRWDEGLPISRMPVDANPNLRYCLLHQQLQLVNCCIARHHRRTEALDTLDALSSAQACVEFSVSSDGDSRLDCMKECKDISPPPVPALYAKLKTGELVLRLGIDRPAGNMQMLETKELVYSPITQEAPVLTEELLRETEELVLRTRSVGAGCSQLFSDMQAFQAANPGCILEDFVRWYSPLDWREAPESGMVPDNQGCEGDEAGVRGYLSARMQSEGNLWQELWASARPVPAFKQAPLFDEELAGESTLDALEDVAPSDLFEQLFTVALSAGFAIAEAAPMAKKEPLCRYLRQCSEYVMSTCGRGMSSAKLEHLCEAYEVMQTAMNLSPEELMGWSASVAAADPNECALSENSQVQEELCDSPKSLLRHQMLKGDSGNIFTRLFEGRASFFDKIPSRKPPSEEEKKPPPPEGDWTMV